MPVEKMVMQLTSFSRATTVFFLGFIAVTGAARQSGACSAIVVRNDPAPKPFLCVFSGKTIPRTEFCNGNNDCGDNLDERFCMLSPREGCLAAPWLAFHCPSRCIPMDWKCDGIVDCPSGNDERDCIKLSGRIIESDTNSATADNSSIATSRRKAIDWLLTKNVPNSSTRKWGPLAHKLAVALYLSDPDFLLNASSVRKEIAYELAIQLLSKINKKKIQSVRSSELASFVNAFLVTCTDPRDFYGWNLVQELRSRVNKQNYTNPYVLLSLCNAGDHITDSDVKKLNDVFWSNNRVIWTDIQAVALMALSCARNQTDSTVDAGTLKELALELKQHQHRNGTVENLRTTLLVMQALYAAESDEDPDNFDENKALTYILQNQKPDGSFGNFLLTYYALPVLNCKSLVNISSGHCKKEQKDEATAMLDLMNHAGPKNHIRYSIWIGVEKDVERSLTLRVPANTSFYGVMEIAAELDSKYKFDYVVSKRKPYITAVYGIMDDPESEQFWFPFTIISGGQPSLIQKSTADVIPEKDSHIVMWYRKGNWAES